MLFVSIKHEIKCAKTFEMLTVAFGESTKSRTQVQFCLTGLRKDIRPGRLNMSATDKNIEAVKKMILDNHRITIREAADDKQFLRMF